jgi:hypothetical protein
MYARGGALHCDLLGLHVCEYRLLFGTAGLFMDLVDCCLSSYRVGYTVEIHCMKCIRYYALLA